MGLLGAVPGNSQPHIATAKCCKLYWRLLVSANCNHSLEINAILKCKDPFLSCGGDSCVSGVIDSMRIKDPGQL